MQYLLKKNSNNPIRKYTRTYFLQKMLRLYMRNALKAVNMLSANNIPVLSV
jgi:hypothetical protein